VWVQPAHYKIVGDFLAAARRRANITQVELATRLGQPQSLISDYERGGRRVDLIEFLLIAKALAADPVAIFAEIAGASATPGKVAPSKRRSKGANSDWGL
jgi:transcriptional regulator with XRE-family HTH domain